MQFFDICSENVGKIRVLLNLIAIYYLSIFNSEAVLL